VHVVQDWNDGGNNDRDKRRSLGTEFIARFRPKILPADIAKRPKSGLETATSVTGQRNRMIVAFDLRKSCRVVPQRSLVQIVLFNGWLHLFSLFPSDAVSIELGFKINCFPARYCNARANRSKRFISNW
jgi:hypothetical protein